MYRAQENRMSVNSTKPDRHFYSNVVQQKALSNTKIIVFIASLLSENPRYCSLCCLLFQPLFYLFAVLCTHRPDAQNSRRITRTCMKLRTSCDFEDFFSEMRTSFHTTSTPSSVSMARKSIVDSRYISLLYLQEMYARR